MDDSDDTPKLIQCGDHGYAPWGVVCVHLIKGTSKEWCRLDNPDGNTDWVCPSCLANLTDENIENLHAICMHCIRKIQAKAGFDPLAASDDK